MPVAPEWIAAAPRSIPPLHSLLASANFVDEPAGARWESGFTFQPENCIEAEVWNPCGIPSEIDQILVIADAGTWFIVFDGNMTTALPFNATAAQVQAALEALPNIAPGDVFVTATVIGNQITYILTWAGAYLGLPIGALLTATTALPPGVPAPGGVALLTAIDYSILAGSTVTNTGPTTVEDNLGLFPGTAVVGFPPGIVGPPGVQNINNGAALQAQTDLTAAYIDAAGRPITATVTADLAGLTLTPGVYAGPAHSPLANSGLLTLDGGGDPDAVFIFQTDSTLITAVGSSMVLINGARECNVFWQVGSSATLGVGSTFIGTIMALASITANTGALIMGRLLARNAAVTLDSNVITAPTCAGGGNATPGPGLTLAGQAPGTLAVTAPLTAVAALAPKKDFDGDQTPRTYQPGIIDVPYTCSSFGLEEANYEEKAMRQLEVGKGKALEREFWTGEKTPSNGSLVLSTPNDDAHVLNPGGAAAPVAVSPGIALMLFAQALANCGPGQRGMIHATAGLAERWMNTTAVASVKPDEWCFDPLNIRGCRVLVTGGRGDIIVSGSGYPGTGPLGQPAPGPNEAWAYATGMVDVREGEMELIPSTLKEAFNRATNTVTFRGEVTAAAVFDGCCIFAVLVDLCAGD